MTNMPSAAVWTDCVCIFWLRSLPIPLTFLTVGLYKVVVLILPFSGGDGLQVCVCAARHHQPLPPAPDEGWCQKQPQPAQQKWTGGGGGEGLVILGTMPSVVVWCGQQKWTGKYVGEVSSSRCSVTRVTSKSEQWPAKVNSDQQHWTDEGTGEVIGSRCCVTRVTRKGEEWPAKVNRWGCGGFSVISCVWCDMTSKNEPAEVIY